MTNSPPSIVNYDPSTIAGAIAWGVVAGILFAIRELWLRIFTPWYEERLYRGAKIEGFWRSTTNYQDGGSNQMVYHFQRKGHRIWGDISCIEGIDKGRKWNFHGQFKDLIL